MNCESPVPKKKSLLSMSDIWQDCDWNCFVDNLWQGDHYDVVRCCRKEGNGNG